MDCFQCGQDIFNQPTHLLLWQTPLPLQHLAERLALHIVHHDVGGAIGFEKVPHPHHTGVVDFAQNLGFIKKALQPPRVAGILAGLGGRQATLGVGQDIHIVAIPVRPLDRKVFLDGRPGLQRLVNSLVGDPEAARAEHRFNSVLMQTITDGQRIGFLDHGILVVASAGAVRTHLSGQRGFGNAQNLVDHASWALAVPFN